MTAREAANLLLGLNGADAPKDAPLAIDRFRSLRFHIAETEHEEHQLAVFKAIDGCENLGVALELLIEGMPEILIGAFAFIDAGHEKENLRALYKRELLGPGWSRPPIVLRVAMKRYYAEIELKTWVGSSVQDARWRTEFKAEFVQDADRFMDGFYGKMNSDRSVTVEFTGRTLLKLWLTLHKDTELGLDTSGLEKPAAMRASPLDGA
jgi:hypothetical protein